MMSNVMMKSKKCDALNFGPKNIAQKRKIMKQNQKKNQKL